MLCYPLLASALPFLYRHRHAMLCSIYHSTSPVCLQVYAVCVNISLLFWQPRKEDKTDELGSGRAIPLKQVNLDLKTMYPGLFCLHSIHSSSMKPSCLSSVSTAVTFYLQGYLYKKGSKGITKDWKKKYVTLTSGKLIYHPNMHVSTWVTWSRQLPHNCDITTLCIPQDYMDDVHGKEIELIQTTVKIPGQNKPRLNSQLSNGGSFNEHLSKSLTYSGYLQRGDNSTGIARCRLALLQFYKFLFILTLIACSECTTNWRRIDYAYHR